MSSHLTLMIVHHVWWNMNLYNGKMSIRTIKTNSQNNIDRSKLNSKLNELKLAGNSVNTEWNDRTLTIKYNLNHYSMYISHKSLITLNIHSTLSIALLNYLNNFANFRFFLKNFWEFGFIHGGILGSLGSPLATCLHIYVFLIWMHVSY